MGLKWNVGTSESINIWEDCWVPRSLPGKVQTSRSGNIERVSELILPNGMGWNRDLIDSLFVVADAILIQGINLPSIHQGDCLVLRGEHSGIYSACSGYRLLFQQLTPLSSRHDVFKQIQATRCPPKTKIALWKFVHGFVATRSCLYNRRVANNPSCPRCNVDYETVNHVLRFCAKAKDVWVMLGYPLHVVSAQMDFYDLRHSSSVVSATCGVVKINVDAGFRLNQKKAAAGVVIRDENGEILRACCKITYLVLSVFAAEVVTQRSFMPASSTSLANLVTKQHMQWRKRGLSRGEDGYWVEEAPTLVEAMAAEDCCLHEPP
ncbi:hypothetical protein Goklo_024437 [Gossypium klotzschianum]|uniref:Reverse transcriptase zinc-binding domain-containing protein n=1 Tax=Gossypium klotzschianum TaxID=34286 RepID=A0A7J8W9E3_9ROSI|nr:hypothetical protein [Gossypium klotzschianum]